MASHDVGYYIRLRVNHRVEAHIRRDKLDGGWVWHVGDNQRTMATGAAKTARKAEVAAIEALEKAHAKAMKAGTDVSAIVLQVPDPRLTAVG